MVILSGASLCVWVNHLDHSYYFSSEEVLFLPRSIYLFSAGLGRKLQKKDETWAEKELMK